MREKCEHLSEIEYMQVIEALFYEKPDERTTALYNKVKHCSECMSIIKDGWISLRHLHLEMEEMDEIESIEDPLKNKNSIDMFEKAKRHFQKDEKKTRKKKSREREKKDRNIPILLFSSQTGAIFVQHNTDVEKPKEKLEDEAENLLAADYRTEEDLSFVESFTFQSRLHPSHLFLIETRRQPDLLKFNIRLKFAEKNNFAFIALQESKKKHPSHLVSCNTSKNNFVAEFSLPLPNKKEYFFIANDKYSQEEILFYVRASQE